MIRALLRIPNRVLRAILRRVIPRSLDIAYRRSRALLLLEPENVERTFQQDFFDRAFKALKFNGIDGDYAEFGCASAKTFALAYRESRKHGHPAKLWAFDSFSGLPDAEGVEDDHPRWQHGTMAMSVERFHEACRQNGIPGDAYTTVAGYYDDTLPRMGATEEPANICLAYIDCDLYSSTVSVLEFLMPRLKHGMIVAFDDYYCWSASQPAGERKAMLEFFEDNSQWGLLPFVQYGWHGASFVVENRELLRPKQSRHAA